MKKPKSLDSAVKKSLHKSFYGTLLTLGDISEKTADQIFNETKLLVALLDKNKDNIQKNIDAVNWSLAPASLAKTLLTSSRPDIVAHAPLDWKSLAVRSKSGQEKEGEKESWLLTQAFSSNSVFFNVEAENLLDYQIASQKRTKLFWDGVFNSGALNKKSRVKISGVGEEVTIRDLHLFMREEGVFTALPPPKNHQEAELSLACLLKKNERLNELSTGDGLISDEGKKYCEKIFEKSIDFNHSFSFNWPEKSQTSETFSLGALCLANVKFLKSFIDHEKFIKKIVPWFLNLSDLEKTKALSQARRLTKNEPNFNLILNDLSQDLVFRKDILKNECIEMLRNMHFGSTSAGRKYLQFLSQSENLNILDTLDLKDIYENHFKKGGRIPLTSKVKLLNIFQEEARFHARFLADYWVDVTPKTEIGLSTMLVSIDKPDIQKMKRKM